MSIALPATAILPLVQPLNVAPVGLYAPATVSPRSIVATLDWANDYGAGLANPDINVLIGLAGAPGGAQSAIDQVKSVKIDNTDNDYPVFVYFLDTTDTIVAPPNTIIWEPVVTNSKVANAILKGAEDANLGVTRVYFCNFIVPPYVNAQQPESVELRLASPLIGGGSALSDIEIDVAGSWYNSGTLSIAGGGGVNAAAHGMLDQYGRFTAVVIDDAGTEFIGPPMINATGTQTAPAAWIAGQGATKNVTMCSYGGTTWICGNFSIGAGSTLSYTPPPNNTEEGPLWNNLGISSTPQIAEFTGDISTSTGILTNSEYGPSALGDQGANFQDTFAAPGIFRNNLFGTPLGSGIITITAINVNLIKASAAAAAWSLESASRDLFDFAIPASLAGQSLLNMSGMNLKLDATVDWYLNAATATEATQVSHGFAWTYTP